MTRPIAIVFVAVAMLGGVACGSDPEPEPFSFVGQVFEVREGIEPEDVPVTDSGGNADAEGGFVIRPREGEDPIDCRADVGAYLVYFNEGTEFVPASIVKAPNFPRILRGQLVGIEGTFFKDGPDCTFVAERAGAPEAIENAGGEADPTATPGRTRRPNATPKRSPKNENVDKDENPATSTATDTARKR
jgi:hypothetical protein